MNSWLGNLVENLRRGDWLTFERIRFTAGTLLVAVAVAVLAIILTSDGRNDYQGRPLGSDFSNVYAAGSYVLEKRFAAPFDWRLQHKRETEIFGAETQFYGWHYPPFFLFVAGALATMPYLLALAAWQVVTLLLYLLCIHAILFSSSSENASGASLRDSGRGRSRGQLADPLWELSALGSPLWMARQSRIWLLLALAFPAVFVNIGHGHNGFLTAALFGGALVMLDSRPVLAGFLFGLVSYKPQFGVLIPLVLMASGRWAAFATAAATIVWLVVVTTLIFGVDVWWAFYGSLHLTQTEVLEAGGTGWHKIQSVFAWVRMWGGGVSFAYTVQGAVALAIVGALVLLWRSDARFPLKAAALATGAILATPYSLDYDMMVLAPTIAYLAADGMARGFAPWEKSALALLWLAPLIARVTAEHVLIPLGPWAMLAIFALTLRRAASDIGILTNRLPA